MRAVVFTLGCKVNQCEGQSMISVLGEHGIYATDKLEPADFYIINTCSVTAESDRKSRQAVARVLRLNPQAKVYICGCSSQNSPDAFTAKNNVRLVSGTGKKTDLVTRILEDLEESGHGGISVVGEPPRVYEDDLFPRHTKTRSYIKIQDGCNNFCSYCIVPYLRGRSRSRQPDSIVAEAEIAANATREIVLTGINTSAYGKDIGSSLGELMKKLGTVPVRKRLSSLECTVIDEELLRAMADNGFCDHFHLSLQSGSGTVLSRMNRHYTPEFFLEKVGIIRKVFPNAGITTDVITGFGGESEEEFRETVEFVQKVAFSDMHVFPYSERKGTKAYDLPQIDKRIRQERATELISIAEKMRTAFERGQLGSVGEVYAETEEDGDSVGYTSNYIKVYSDLAVGEIGKVTLEKLYKQGVRGNRNGQ